MLLKKRQVLTATLIIALCAAITVNWYFTKPESESNELTTSVDEAVTGNLGDTLFVAGTTVSKETEINEDETSSEAEDEETQAVSAKDYFSSAKLKRQNTYDEAIDNIEKILNDESIENSQKNEISVMLSDYQNDMKIQTDAENLITAKTGRECLVVINGEECQVVLEKNTLTDTIILQITEIIEKNANIFSENLTIIELK